MTTHTERQRLAAMANTLRPDWPPNSIHTLLATEPLALRAYRDTALAIAWIATDPDTRTPARLREPGPWWQAPRTEDGPLVMVTDRQPCCGGFHPPDPTSQLCNPPERARSYGRGAKAARTALRTPRTQS